MAEVLTSYYHLPSKSDLLDAVDIVHYVCAPSHHTPAVSIARSVAEPELEPPGAGLFGWSRSRKKYEVSAPAPGEL